MGKLANNAIRRALTVSFLYNFTVLSFNYDLLVQTLKQV